MVTIAGGIILAFVILFVVLPVLIAVFASIGVKKIALGFLLCLLGVLVFLNSRDPARSVDAKSTTTGTEDKKDWRYLDGIPPKVSTEPLRKVQVGPQGNMIGFDGTQWVDVKTRRPYWDTDSARNRLEKIY